MIADLVNFVENLKIEQVLVVFALYLVFLWVLVPIWVFLDSKRKFNNTSLSVLLFILVLPLNIPGLLFYIIIRPNEFETIDDIPFNDNLFNVPVVNFVTDKKDLVFGIELKINGNILKPEIAKDLDLKISLDHSPEVELIKESRVKKDPSMAFENLKSKFMTAKVGISSKLNKVKDLSKSKFAKSDSKEKIDVSDEVSTTKNDNKSSKGTSNTTAEDTNA